MHGRLEGVTDTLMIPEYLMYKLCGVKAREYTEASTGGMISAKTGEFDMEIVDKLGLPRHLFPKLSQPGTVLGELLPEIAQRVGGNCSVVLCATHDTGSAVEGIPMEDNQPFISSGTWSLLGVKIPQPLTDEGSYQTNYSNEGGVGYNRYQKNIMGMWLFQNVRKNTDKRYTYDQMMEMAKASDFVKIIDVNHPTLVAPQSMIEAVNKLAGDESLPGLFELLRGRFGDGLARRMFFQNAHDFFLRNETE
jgi:rhamnulokinase